MSAPQPEPVLQRPRVVSAASVLWILLGAMLILSTLYAWTEMGIGSLAWLIVAGIGVIFLLLGYGVRRGSTAARTRADFIGGLLSIFGLPLIFAVPAIILQHRPSANAWFAHMQMLRRSR
jgi:hypothetical protein